MPKSWFCVINNKMVFGSSYDFGFIYGNKRKKTNTNGH